LLLMLLPVGAEVSGQLVHGILEARTFGGPDVLDDQPASYNFIKSLLDPEIRTQRSPGVMVWDCKQPQALLGGVGRPGSPSDADGPYTLASPVL
jgi:hypothetical protein